MTWERPQRPRRGWDTSPETEPTYTISNVISKIVQIVAGGVLRAGKSSYTDTDTGFWLGVDTDGVAKFNIGTGTWYIRWTGTRLEMAGKLVTGNGYVKIIDDNTDTEEEGICLLQNTWAASGALRWQTSGAKVGGRMAAYNNGTNSTDFQIRAYPRTTGTGNGATFALAAYSKAYGEASPRITSLEIASANEQVSTAGALLAGGSLDQTQLLISGNPDGQTADLAQFVGSSESEVAALDNAGNLDLAGALYVDGTQVVGRQQGALADLAETGSAEDGLARAKINDILAALRAHGLIGS